MATHTARHRISVTMEDLRRWLAAEGTQLPDSVEFKWRGDGKPGRTADPLVDITWQAHPMKTFTVDELAKKLALLPPEMEVILRIQGDDESVAVCGLHAVSVEQGCTDTPALMLDGCTDEDAG